MKTAVEMLEVDYQPGDRVPWSTICALVDEVIPTAYWDDRDEAQRWVWTTAHGGFALGPAGPDDHRFRNFERLVFVSTTGGDWGASAPTTAAGLTTILGVAYCASNGTDHIDVTQLNQVLKTIRDRQEP